MTYRELQEALKQYKEQGLTTINLNSKKDILIAEYGMIIGRTVTVKTVEKQEKMEEVTTVKTAEYYRKTVQYYNEQAIIAMMNKKPSSEVQTYINLANQAIEKMKEMEKQEVTVTETECLFTGDLHINQYVISEDTRKWVNGKTQPITYSVFDNTCDNLGSAVYVGGSFETREEAKQFVISLIHNQQQKSKILISV